MSYTFMLQPGGELALVVFEGRISPEEERQAVLDFAELPGLDPLADVLVDRTRASMTVEPSDVGRQIRVVKSSLPKAQRRPKMAIVAPRDFDFGMARMLELTGGDDLPHQLMVVRDLIDACAWLDVDPGDIIWPEGIERPARKSG